MKINPVQTALVQSMTKLANPMNTPSVQNTGQFSDVLRTMLNKTNESQMKSANLAERLQMDDPNVSIEETVLASNEASLNFQFVMQTRNKLTEAYQTLMNTQV